MSDRRVVVTGIGIVSPVGNDLASSWQNIKAGVSGVSSIDEFDTTNFTVTIAATVKDFDASPVIAPKDQKKMDTFIHYGLVAAEEALQDSGLEITEASLEVIEATGVEINWERVDAGEPALEKHGTVLPPELFESVRKNRVALKGPVATPIGGGHRSVNVTIRSRSPSSSAGGKASNSPS